MMSTDELRYAELADLLAAIRAVVGKEEKAVSSYPVEGLLPEVRLRKEAVVFDFGPEVFGRKRGPITANPTSRAILRANVGETSRLPWKGTVVVRPIVVSLRGWW
jgi:hypothetical protein